jgi:signal transduction histidine kinase
MPARGIPRLPFRNQPRPFERRLLIVLVLFSLVPTLVLLGLGAFLVSEAVYITGAPAAWERAAGTGVELIRAAEVSGDPALEQAAAQHREELSASLTQARRWEFLLRRSIAMLPVVTLLLGLLLGWLALRAARGMARGMASPIHELVEWAGRVARGEPLPEQPETASARDEFGVLRDAFRTMTAELAASRQRALEAERMRTWVSMARQVAHELKNPLTPMRLAVHTLQRGVQPSNAAHSEALEVIAAEAERLDELARAFAQFGRLPEGPPSEIDLAEMLEYLLRSHLPSEMPHRLLAPPDLPRIHGHHDALNRAFANLILNAADAMEGRRGSLQVKLALLPGQDAVEIRFLDSGPGIPPEQLERIWEPDFSTKRRGTGLGLALVRQTAHAHGGRAWARNRPEGGAEFRVVLPVESLQSSVVSRQSEQQPQTTEGVVDPTSAAFAPKEGEISARSEESALRATED